MPGGVDAGECLAGIRIERGEHHHPTHPHEKKSQKSRKKFATNKKIPTFAIPNKKGKRLKFFEVYFWRIQGVLTMKEGVTSW